MTLARVGAIKDFRGAGLKVDQARVLKECLQPGGETYNMLVISGRLKPTKVERPKDGGNPSDGLSSSSKSQTHQTLETQLRHFCKTLACVVDTSTSQLLLAQCDLEYHSTSHTFNHSEMCERNETYTYVLR